MTWTKVYIVQETVCIRHITTQSYIYQVVSAQAGYCHCPIWT